MKTAVVAVTVIMAIWAGLLEIKKRPEIYGPIFFNAGQR